MVKIKDRPVIVTLTSGLGNQMFQYALYRYLKNNGREVILAPFERYLNEHNGYELNRIFGSSVEKPSSARLIKFYIGLYWFLNGRISNILKRITVNLSNKLLHLIPYDIIVFPGWMDYKFIPELGNSLYNIFKFPDLTDKQNLLILKQIRNSESVSLHIRRGDFQNVNKWRMALGDICDLDYYRKAIEELNNHVPNPQFFVFSDDMDWVKQNLKLESANYIDWNKGSDSFKDLELMAECKHNILSNSTFSLWGAWLNKNTSKVVIVPQKWQHNYNDNTREIYLHPTWIQIDNNKPYISLILKDILSEKSLKDILNQLYTDFEIISKLKYSGLDDERIQPLNASPKGYFKIDITEKESKKYSNKKYLGKLLDQMMDNERYKR